eukprot:m.129474 g.129474  ORF g.129474 m.129474 type:complete len:479 (-) comp23643_c0_seq3:22-1458(-)
MGDEEDIVALFGLGLGIDDDENENDECENKFSFFSPLKLSPEDIGQKETNATRFCFELTCCLPTEFKEDGAPRPFLTLSISCTDSAVIATKAILKEFQSWITLQHQSPCKSPSTTLDIVFGSVDRPLPVVAALRKILRAISLNLRSNEEPFQCQPGHLKTPAGVLSFVTWQLLQAAADHIPRARLVPKLASLCSVNQVLPQVFWISSQEKHMLGALFFRPSAYEEDPYLRHKVIEKDDELRDIIAKRNKLGEFCDFEHYGGYNLPLRTLSAYIYAYGTKFGASDSNTEETFDSTKSLLLSLGDAPRTYADFAKKFQTKSPNLSLCDELLLFLVWRHLDASTAMDHLQRICFVGSDHQRGSLKHELAHGLYCSNLKYRERVDEILQALTSSQRERMCETLKSPDYSYHEAVTQDEIHAYLLDRNMLGCQHDDDKLLEQLREIITKLQAVWNEKMKEGMALLPQSLFCQPQGAPPKSWFD